MTVGGANLIKLLSAHPTLAGQNRSENRLTAALAAVLTKAPATAALLFELCLPGDHESVAVTLERPIGPPRGGRVDLVLTSRDGGTPCVVWIEVKLRSGFTGPDQLDKYHEGLELHHEHARKQLVLLAPAASRTDLGGLPPLQSLETGSGTAGFLAWEEVYGLFRDWLQTGEASEIEAWLTRELLDYMREEEELEPTEALNQGDLDVLRSTVRALATLEQVVSGAAGVIARDWQPAVKTDKSDMNAEFPPSMRDADQTQWPTDTTFFLWADEVNFWAGAWLPKSTVGVDDWATSLAPGGAWSVDPDTYGCSVYREEDTATLLSETTADAQSELLARSVLDVFSQLSTAGPPSA